MRKPYLLVATLAVAILLIAMGPVSADRSAMDSADSEPRSRLAGASVSTGCSSDPWPEVIHLAEGALLQGGVLHLVKGPQSAIANTFPETLWEEPFPGTSNWVALVMPEADTPWPPTSQSASPESLESSDAGSDYNSWRIVEGWRTPFLMFSFQDDLLDVVSLGDFETGDVIRAQVLDHLNHFYNGQDRPVWIYLVRGDGTEVMLAELEIADPAQVTITVPEPGELQLRTHDSTVWWVQCLPAPSISVTKTAVPESRPEPGGTFRFIVRVDNTSPMGLSLTALEDDVCGDIADASNPMIENTTCALPVVLSVDGWYECAFNINFFGEPRDSQTDIVIATGRDEYGREVQAQDDATINITDVASAIEVTKTADPTSVPELGAEVAYSVVVENTSAVDEVTIYSIVDDQFGDISGSCSRTLPATLSTGASMSCGFSAYIGGQPGDSHTNVVTAEGIDDDGESVSDSDDALVQVINVPSTIEVTKTADPASVPEPGADVAYSVVVENTSAVDEVTIYSIVDNQFGNISGSCSRTLPATLVTGASMSCGFSAYIGGEPGDSHTNLVTAEGIDDDGESVSDSDDALVEVIDVPSVIEVIKTASPYWMYYPGGNVVFRVTVTNQSAVDTVTINNLVDSVYGDLNVRGDCTVPQHLVIGGSYACSFEAVVMGEPDSTHTNVVTASGIDSDGQAVSDWDSATVTISQLPTTIELLYFRATTGEGLIAVEWETIWEQNNWGFNLYRGTTPSFEEAAWLHFTQAQGSGQFQGRSYRYEDTEIIPGQEYYYWLEDVGMAGDATQYGPVTAAFLHRIFVPLVRR